MNFAVRFDMRSTIRLSVAFAFVTCSTPITSVVHADPTTTAAGGDGFKSSTESFPAHDMTDPTVNTTDVLGITMLPGMKNRTGPRSSVGDIDTFQNGTWTTHNLDDRETHSDDNSNSSEPSTTMAVVATATEAHEISTKETLAPDVVSQSSSTVNTATGSGNATSESSVYNASSLEPTTRNDTTVGGIFERVLLRDYTEFHAVRGKLTHRRRTKPSNQLVCVAGCGEVFPTEIICIQRNNSGPSVQWRCNSSLPNNLTLVVLSLDCEGYERPQDEYITRDSCRVRFSLQNRTHIVHVKDEHAHHPHRSRFNPDVLNPSDDNFLILPYLIPAVVLVGGIILVVMVFTCFCPKDKEESAVPPVTTYQPPVQPQFQQPPMNNASPMALQQQSFENPHSNPHPFASPNFNPGYPPAMQPAQYGAYPNAPPMAYPQQAPYPPGMVPQQPYPQPQTQVIQQPVRSGGGGGGVASGIGGLVAGAAAGGLAGYAINSMMHQNHSEGEANTTTTTTTTTTNVEDQNIDVIAEYPDAAGGMYGGVEDQPAYGTTTTTYVEPSHGNTDTYVAPTYDAEDTYTQPAYDDGGDDFGGGDYD